MEEKMLDQFPPKPYHKGDKKLINGWAMYDWANSVYSLVITSAVFPIYYNSVTPKEVDAFGRTYLSGALYTYSLSFAFFVIAFISPILSSIADYRRDKLFFMKCFCYLGAASCASLYFYDGTNIYLGIIPFSLAAIGFCGSLVFYNAFLPEIAFEKDQDRVSAKGFSLGYIGSVLLLIVNLMMIMKPNWFALGEGKLPAQISFLTVGIWWALFAQITFARLGRFQKNYNSNLAAREKKFNSIWGGFSELKKVLIQLKSLGRLRNFLFGFFFYSMALQTVMYIATIFGTEELKLPQTQLILTVLIIQLVAIGGAYLFSTLSARNGNIKTLRVAIFIWIIICIMAYLVFKYFAVDEQSKSISFYFLAFCVGMVMGGTQSLSRSTYSKLLPETEDHASFFSFYDVSEKIAIVVGTVSYGLIYELTGSMLNALLAFTVFFLIGMYGLFQVKKES